MQGARFLVLRSVWRLGNTQGEERREVFSQLQIRMYYYDWLAKRHNLDGSFESFIGDMELSS